MRSEIPLTTKPIGKDAILVLGMHRSGTSMLAGILDCLGCKGPKTRPEANDRNPKGYFESIPIFQLNDEILATAGTRWNDWQPLRKDWLSSPRFSEFRSRAAELILQEYGSASMIYLKDPRMCRLLPLWQDVFDEMGYRVSCIHTHRHPLEVATSMKARKNIEVEPSLGTLSWLRYTLEAEVASRGLPRIFTNYSNLIHDWQGFIPRTEKAFGFIWPVMTPAASERIGQLVDPGLRHHEASIEAFLSDPVVPELFRETLRVLESWCLNGEDEDDRLKLDHLHHSFDLSAPLFYAPTRALEAATRKVKDLTPHKSAAEARQAEIGTLSSKLAEVEGQREQLLSQREQLRAELEQNRADMEEAQARAETLATKLNGAEAREAKLFSEVTMWASRNVDRDKKISGLQRRADLDRHDRTARQAEAESQRNLLLSEKEQLCAELEQLQTNTVEAQMRGEALAAKLDEASAVSADQEEWFFQAFCTLENQPWWWRLMPKKWIMPRQHNRLRLRKLFDVQKYIELNPDVAAGGMDPVRHYILHGMREGRIRTR